MRRLLITAAVLAAAALCLGARSRTVWEIRHADEIARWCLEADSSAVPEWGNR